jgi:Protein of unknown function (DUF3168)
MTIFLNPVQQAIYARLVSQITTINIYDDPPNQPDGMPAANFPYIVIGEDTSAPFDTDDSLGSSMTITLHVWSRYHGKKEAKTILGLIYTALNRKAAYLLSPGFRFIDCLSEFSEVIEEVDGVTRHGVCRYRVLIEKE